MELNYPKRLKHYNYTLLNVSNKYDGDCLKVMELNKMNDKDHYIFCAHILPEAWSGEKQHWVDLEEKGVIEHVDFNGSVGKFSWMISKFLPRSYPTLMSYHGIFSLKSCPKVAKIFNTPTNWKNDCNFVSKINCKLPYEVTHQPPLTNEEEDSYFNCGSYTGFF